VYLERQRTVGYFVTPYRLRDCAAVNDVLVDGEVRMTDEELATPLVRSHHFLGKTEGNSETLGYVR
jgi:hypothetical protein